MINRQFIENLKPAELEPISSYIYDPVKKKVGPDTPNHLNIEVKCCPGCGSLHFVRNGHDLKGRQKYLCKDCRKPFVSTTGSLFSRSRISYSEWTNFIAGELNGLTLEQQSVQISRSVKTCFCMRHKLYRAIGEIMDRSLSGLIELDPTYESINLKGTKRDKMPRISKKRSQSNSGKGPQGFNPHDVCIVAAVQAIRCQASISCIRRSRYSNTTKEVYRQDIFPIIFTGSSSPRRSDMPMKPETENLKPT